MADRSLDQATIALDLVLREMELHAGNINTFRGTVGTVLSLGVTINAALAASVGRMVMPSAANVAAAFSALGVFVTYGVALLWLARGALEWPDGAAILRTGFGSTFDLKRGLVFDMRRSITRVEYRFSLLQLSLVPLLMMVAQSVGLWIWVLTTSTPITTTRLTGP